VKITVDDARHYMSRAQTQYDVIVLDIFFPMSSGSSSVFSQEYFQLCQKRLAPGGLVCQWLPIHQLSMEQIKTIVATFQSVFPHTSLWFGTISDRCRWWDASVLKANQSRFDRSERSLSLFCTKRSAQTPLLLSHFILATSR